MASGDSSWAQARALGFLASVSDRVSIKRILILLLGPASNSSVTEPSKPERKMKHRNNFWQGTTKEKGWAYKDDGLKHVVLRQHQEEILRTLLCVCHACLTSPAGFLSPPLWVTCKRSHTTEKSSSCNLEKQALSARKSSYFYLWPSDILLQYPSPAPSTIFRCNELPGAAKAHHQFTHSAKNLKHLLPPLVLPAMASLALLCSSFYESVPPPPSSVTASILLPPFSYLLLFHFLLVFSNLIFLFFIFLFLPSSKVLLSFTTSSFTWLGGKEESNKFTVSHKFTGTQRQHSNTVPCPAAYTLHAGCHIHSLGI